MDFVDLQVLLSWLAQVSKFLCVPCLVHTLCIFISFQALWSVLFLLFLTWWCFVAALPQLLSVVCTSVFLLIVLGVSTSFIFVLCHVSKMFSWCSVILLITYSTKTKKMYHKQPNETLGITILSQYPFPHRSGSCCVMSARSFRNKTFRGRHSLRDL